MRGRGRSILRRLAIVGSLALLCLLLAASGAVAEITPDYFVSERPDPPGTPTKVEIGLYLLDLSAIDDLAQDFTIDFYVTARWRDGRLASGDGADDGPTRILPLTEVWNPAIGALNRRDVATLFPDTVRVDSRGNVEYAQRIQGQFASPLDLREFPTDEQTLVVRLASFRYGPDEVVLEIAPEKTGRRESLSIAGWRIGQLETEVAPRVVSTSSNGARAGAIYRLRAERQTTYYVLTLVIPLLLIALMAWSVFWIDPVFLNSQIGVSTASVFSLIAFRVSLNLSLPKVAYLTKADWFVLAITILVFAACGEAVLTGSLSKAGREDLAHAIDLWARWIYIGVLAAVFLVLK